MIPLVTSKPLVKEAIANVSKDAAAEKYEVARVGAKYEDGLIVTVDSLDPQVPAEKLLEKLANALESHLCGLDSGRRRDELQAELMAKEVEQISQELRKEQEALATLATIHRVSLNPELMVQRRMQLEAEHQNLGVQLEGLKARREVIEKQIAQLAGEVAKAAANDEVLKQLEKSVALRKHARDAVRRSLGEQVLTEDKSMTPKTSWPRQRRKSRNLKRRRRDRRARRGSKNWGGGWMTRRSRWRRSRRGARR
jgi:hypothetical protein